jgi:diaminohydroxyphosphoribosylaminopyrimidine deaminase/5-amino-6-(5-phosphoribosylamino)uracil reductase
MKFTKENIKYMRTALALAQKGKGAVFPNPMVGCVIVKKSKIISTGYHKIFGALHAEADALNKAGAKARGADLYVNLEPCVNFGKRPPCADHIIKAGVKRVFIAAPDVNTVTRFKGIEKLRSAGIEVFSGLLEKEAKTLNKQYIKHINSANYSVSVKYAMTLDGKIATKDYDSKWITGAPARNFAHKLRVGHNGVLAGFNTVMRDNPSLTSHGKGQNPVRVVIDQNLKIPKHYNVFNNEAPTIIVCDEKIKKTPPNNAIVLKINFKTLKKDFNILISRLRVLGLKTIFIEGGGETIASALSSGCVNKVYAFVAPLIIGGRNSISPVEGFGVSKVAQGLKIKKMKVKKIGKDFLFEGNL